LGPLGLAKHIMTDSKWQLQMERHCYQQRPQSFSKRDSTARGRETVCLLHPAFETLL